jgi:hypothetical protein
VDHLLNEWLPVMAWQWANLLACWLSFCIGGWLCLTRLHAPHPGNHGPLLALRWAVALCTVAFGLVGLATLEVLFGGAEAHKPTEIALNVALALLFLAVWRFHRNFVK